MCEAASLVITKDKVLWLPQVNGHTQILKENKIEDKTTPPNFVKVEITPPLKDDRPDYYAPLDKWIYKVDEYSTPKWYVQKVDEKRARKELVNWYQSHILGKCTDAKFAVFSAGDGSTLTGGNGSTLTGGYGSTLTGGDRSTLTGGNCSTLTGGNGSTLTGGARSTLTGGYVSTLTGGARSTLTGGEGSTLTGGDLSTLTGGNGSTLTAGVGSTLTACVGSTLTAGDGSVLIIRWHDGNKCRVATHTVTDKEGGKTFELKNGKLVIKK